MAVAESYISNNPPVDLLTGDALREKLQDDHRDLLKRRDELLAAESRIPEIDDDEVARKVTDFIKQLTAAEKAAEVARVGSKEPFLAASRGVDGFFRAVSDPLYTLKKKIEGRLTLYLRQKEAIERRKREEEAARLREEAERTAREAAEKARALREEADLQAAVEAEKAADVAAADAVKADQAATVKPADLSRVRGEFGAVSSLRTSWVFADVDRATLDLEALRQHLPSGAIDTAIRSFIRAGGRKLTGTRIYETTDAAVH